MNISRTYKNGEFGPWRFSAGTLAEKLHQQKVVRTAMHNLKEARLRYYETEPHGEDHKNLFRRYFKIHQRRGYEIHELIENMEA
jgi:hypothetical protein